VQTAQVIDLRPFARDELVAAHNALSLAFGSDPNAAERDLDLALFTPEQSLGAFDGTDGGASIVGTAAWYDLPMTLPGGSAVVGGVTWVTVAPTHHRRGILRALMSRQLADLHATGHAVAMLWASEPAIYGRFGYGPGSWHLSGEARRGAAFALPVTVGDVRLVVSPSADLLSPIYAKVQPTRPGWYERTPDWWAYRLHDTDDVRGGATSLRAVVIDGEGYALFRTKNEWGSGGADGTVTVGEVCATSPEVEARLWRFLLDLDLMARVRFWGQPVDSPLLHRIADARRLEAKLAEALWVRLVDLPAALLLRAYSAPVDLVLEVVDEGCPWNAGRWRFTGTACERSEDPADVTLDVRELGAAYLGGTSVASRAAAGLVQEHTPGAVAQLSLAMSWHGRAPHSPIVF
jgi:predicted acetyltransferase